VSYAWFRSTEPPGATSFFARDGDGTTAACVNRAGVAGGGRRRCSPTSAAYTG
jgi:hypothetical protein